MSIRMRRRPLSSGILAEYLKDADCPLHSGPKRSATFWGRCCLGSQSRNCAARRRRQSRVGMAARMERAGGRRVVAARPRSACDTTIKPLYGHQEGAELRSLAVPRAFLMAGTRLVWSSRQATATSKSAAPSLWAAIGREHGRSRAAGVSELRLTKGARPCRAAANGRTRARARRGPIRGCARGLPGAVALEDGARSGRRYGHLGVRGSGDLARSGGGGGALSSDAENGLAEEPLAGGFTTRSVLARSARPDAAPRAAGGGWRPCGGSSLTLANNAVPRGSLAPIP